MENLFKNTILLDEKISEKSKKIVPKSRDKSFK